MNNKPDHDELLARLDARAPHLPDSAAYRQLLKERKEARVAIRDLQAKLEAEREDVWQQVIAACALAWPEQKKLFYSASPTELIERIISERDAEHAWREEAERCDDITYTAFRKMAGNCEALKLIQDKLLERATAAEREAHKKTSRQANEAIETANASCAAAESRLAKCFEWVRSKLIRRDSLHQSAYSQGMYDSRFSVDRVMAYKDYHERKAYMRGYHDEGARGILIDLKEFIRALAPEIAAGQIPSFAEMVKGALEAKPLDPDFARVLRDNYWQLIEMSNPAPAAAHIPTDAEAIEAEQLSEAAAPGAEIEPDDNHEVLFALEMAVQHDEHHQALALRTWLPRIQLWYRQYIANNEVLREEGRQESAATLAALQADLTRLRTACLALSSEMERTGREGDADRLREIAK